MTIIYGYHSIVVALEKEIVKVLYLDENRNDIRVNSLLKPTNTCFVSKDYLCNLSNSIYHQGFVAEISEQKHLTLESINLTLEKSLILIVDGVTDKHNLGAIVRTSNFFGVDAIILPKDKSAHIDGSVGKSSAGALYKTAIVIVNNIVRSINMLKSNGYWIIGTSLSPQSINLHEFSPTQKTALIIGNEETGIRKLVSSSCDYLIKIPVANCGVESLNVSVATGIFLSYIKFSGWFV